MNAAACTHNYYYTTESLKVKPGYEVSLSHPGYSSLGDCPSMTVKLSQAMFHPKGVITVKSHAKVGYKSCIIVCS